MTRCTLPLTVLSLGLLFSSAALAAEPSKTAAAEAGAAGKLAGPDETFVKQAAIKDLAEIELGQMAQKQGQSEDVKKFGETMVADHTKASQELKGLVEGKGATLPTELDAKHKATGEKLAKLQGAAFDKAYAAEMVKGHKEAVALFEKASKSAKDVEIKAHAAKTLPTLQAHLEHAQMLAGSTGGGKDKASKGKEEAQ